MLVISDLHLGGRVERDVLRRPAALDALLEAIDAADRLVLLGDIVELTETRARQSMPAAEPVLRAIGGRVGASGEGILVPGNHAAAFARPWLRRRDEPLGIDTAVPTDATPLLAQVTAWLA